MNEILSNCCGAMIYSRDLCAQCHEHCAGMDENGNEYELQGNEWVMITRVLEVTHE